MLIKRIARIKLIILDAFLALTAAAGGVGLLADLNAPPVESLQGSLFPNYTIPGLALLVVVGGGALTALILLLRRHPLGAPASAAAGVIIIGFETVEIWVIGSPAGIARGLQVFYLSLGMLIIILAVGVLWITQNDQ